MLLRITSSLVLGAALLYGGAPPLLASSFTITPVRVEFSAKRIHATLAVTNNGDENVTVQLHPVLWSLSSGKELETDTNDLIFNPPIFTIAPHQTQSVRVGLRRYTTVATEQTYRLILEEVPPPGNSGQGFHMLLRLSIPLFVKPRGPAEAKILWNLERTADVITLSAENRGNTHLQLTRISIVGPDPGNALVVQSRPQYLLCGERAQWVLRGGHIPAEQNILLQAETDGSSISEKLTLSTH